MSKCDEYNKLKNIINSLEDENINIKKELNNYKITINIFKNIILGNENESYGCPIYLFDNKDIRKREYNCKYLIDLYEKYKTEYIKNDKWFHIEEIKILNNTAIHILNIKNIEPNRSNTEN